MCKFERITFLLLLLLSGSCCIPAEQTQPKYPIKVEGWKDEYIGGVHFLGTFVLKKGEATDNGKIGIRLVDIKSPDWCAEPSSYLAKPKAVLKFFNPSDQTTLCEYPFIGGSTQLFGDTVCGPGITKAGVRVIQINAINTKEAWVYFDLRGG